MSNNIPGSSSIPLYLWMELVVQLASMCDHHNTFLYQNRWCGHLMIDVFGMWVRIFWITKNGQNINEDIFKTCLTKDDKQARVQVFPLEAMANRVRSLLILIKYYQQNDGISNPSLLEIWPWPCKMVIAAVAWFIIILFASDHINKSYIHILTELFFSNTSVILYMKWPALHIFFNIWHLGLQYYINYYIYLLYLQPTKLTGIYWFHFFCPSVCPSVCPYGMAIWAAKAIAVRPWHACGLIYMHVGCTSHACHDMEIKNEC